MGHAYTNCLYHIVFGTKLRALLLTDAIRPRLFGFVGGIVEGIGGRALIASGVDDHLHVLARLKHHRGVSDAVRDIKANSSRWIRKTFPDAESFGWQGGYGAFTVSESQVDRVARYIFDQEAHHRTRSFEDEFTSLLRANGIAFDAEHLWD